LSKEIAKEVYTKSNKPQLVIVDWDDAHANNAWEPEESALDRHRGGGVRLVGFLLKQDKAGISVAQGFSENRDVTGHFFVPRGMIKKITKVKY